MSEQRAASSEQRPGGAAPGQDVPAGEPAVVEEISPEGEIVDAEIVEEESGAGEVDEAEAEPGPDPLADALRERDDYLALAQRARADFENFRKRTAAQAAEAERRGRANLARNLLPAIDNLGRALSAAGVDPEDPGSAPDGLGKGVALVLAELLGALERDGVVAFDATGERFDPTLHEAISTAPAEGVEAGTVVETLERGYRAGDGVIRPARVIVSG